MICKSPDYQPLGFYVPQRTFQSLQSSYIPLPMGSKLYSRRYGLGID